MPKQKKVTRRARAMARALNIPYTAARALLLANPPPSSGELRDPEEILIGQINRRVVPPDVFPALVDVAASTLDQLEAAPFGHAGTARESLNAVRGWLAGIVPGAALRATLQVVVAAAPTVVDPRSGALVRRYAFDLPISYRARRDANGQLTEPTLEQQIAITTAYAAAFHVCALASKVSSSAAPDLRVGELAGHAFAAVGASIDAMTRLGQSRRTTLARVAARLSQTATA